MPFPEKTLLTRPVRLIIMGSFIISFFIIAPLVVLYTMGYRFDLDTKTIKTTGVLSIDVLPKKSVVTLNKITLQDAMPIKLFDRAPGRYSVSIEADGYHTWKKDVRIESNQTTYIRGLTLFKNETPKQILQTDTTKAWLSPNGTDSILLETNDDVINIVQLTYADIIANTLITTTTPNSNVLVGWADNGINYVVTIQEADNTRLFSGSTQLKTDHRELKVPSTTPINYQWVDTILQGIRLFVGTPSLSSIIDNLTITTISTTTTNTPLWYMQDSNTKWTYSTTTHRITKDNSDSFSASDQIDDIVFVNQTLVLYRTKTGHTLVGRNSDGSEQISTLPGPRNLFIKNTKEWIVYSPWEITILYNDATYNTIYRTDQPIIDVLTLEDTGVLLIVKKNQLIGFNPGFYTSQTLLKDVDIESVGINRETRNIYFLGTHNSIRGIYSLTY